MDAIDAPTSPFELRDEHLALGRMVGAWAGPTQTWLDPTGAPDEARTLARIDALLGGRFVRIDYRATVMGKPHAGQVILGYDQNEKQYTAAWFDSFHMGTGIMLSTGQAGADGAISVNGSYAYETQRWGWRMVFRQPDGDHLVLQHDNISPDGHEDRAIETRLARVGGGADMATAAWALVLLVAALHVWFLSLEIFLWKTPYARRIFGTTPEFAKESAVMAANQGFYNGILAAGLVWSLAQYGVPAGRPVLTFFLVAVIGAGIFGALTASWKIVLVQSIPGALALGALWLL